MKRVVAALAFVTVACSPPTETASTPEPAGTPAVASAGVTLEQPTIRPPFGGQSIAAGFVTIKNGGAAPDRLVSASSPNAKSIELHTHLEKDGVKSMVRIEGIDVPAGGEALLQPGGLHLMLFDYAAPAGGASVPVQLVFEKAGTVSAEFTVGPASVAGHGMKH